MAEETKKEVAVTKGKEVERVTARPLSPFEDFERMFDELLSYRFPRLFRWDWPTIPDVARIGARVPKLDIIDRDAEVVVRAEVPGVNKEDIEISLTGNVLTIKGESKREEKEEKGDYYRCEISRGAFSRTVSLPAEVDESKAKASLSDGVLEITLPKTETAKKRTIKIQ
ncbi:Hsp20/alpha crystallin family protein [Pelomicrobium sp.]|jgi:HSP20 family protein|uniref:Hsp20/alpha crystallin family protein n=1 Tax=Pelomicrobium sp. TaxID=2815319 RepID=UPI002FDC8495